MRSHSNARVLASADPDECHESDAMLVTRARASDAAAFTTRSDATCQRLRVARAVVIERADAEDVCQDAFVTAFTRLGECQPAEQFRPSAASDRAQSRHLVPALAAGSCRRRTRQRAR